MFLQTIQKTFADLTVDQEELKSLNKELMFTKVELDQTKEHATNLYNRLKDLQSQHIKTVCVLDVLIRIIIVVLLFRLEN